MGPCFAFLFAFDQRLNFPIVLLLFRHVFLKAYLCVFVLVAIETVFVICPASSFFLTSFCTLSKLFWSLHISFHAFARGPQDQRARALRDHRTRTTGPEDHRGPEDQTTRGPQGQRSLNFFSRGCKHFFQGTWFFFPGNVIFFSSIIPTYYSGCFSLSWAVSTWIKVVCISETN